MSGGDNRLGHGLAAMATHIAFMTIDTYPYIQPGGNRQTAMKAGARSAQYSSCTRFTGLVEIHSFSNR